MGSIKYHTTRVFVWYLNVSELNPGPDGIGARAIFIYLIGWNPDISDEQK
jgi:hypothetical protein